MDVMEFANKAWYMDWGFINKPLPEIQKKYKENLQNQKKYFIIKNKKDKWQTITQQEEIFFLFKTKEIIW